MQQRPMLPDWRTIKQLRLAARDGLLSNPEFHILLCPQVFIQEEEDELPMGIVKKLDVTGKEVEDKTAEPIGFHPDKVKE